MSSQFHNRLVGTVVLVALSVIFLPDILDGKKERIQEEFTEIPLRPVIVQDVDTRKNTNELSIAKTKPLATDKIDAKDRNAADSPKDKVKQINSNIKIAQNNDQDNPAWTVQLGSFNDAKNAKSLIMKLRNKGYRAYSLPQNPEHGKLTKVFVGPDISKDRINRLQGEVENLTKLKGKVVPFDPLET